MSTVPASLSMRVFEHWLYQYRRSWPGTALSTLLFPVLFLASIGLGLGSLVDDGGSGAPGGVRYLLFVGPGLLAVTAMQTGVFEGSHPVLWAIKWAKVYQAMLASPLGVLDVLAGHLMWMTARLTLVCGVFLASMVAFGAVASPLAVLALPAAVLTGLAFVTPVVAFAATQESDTGFAALFRFGVTPLFLFSGAFFPVSQLPPVLEQIAYGTPTWHGVELCRGLSLGTVTSGDALVHVGYLSVWVVAGVALAIRTYHRRLVV